MHVSSASLVISLPQDQPGEPAAHDPLNVVVSLSVITYNTGADGHVRSQRHASRVDTMINRTISHGSAVLRGVLALCFERPDLCTPRRVGISAGD